MTVLLSFAKWVLGYVLNAYSFMYIGGKREENKTLKAKDRAINKANRARAKLRSNSSFANKLRSKFTRNVL